MRGGAHISFESVLQREAHGVGQFITTDRLASRTETWVGTVMRAIRELGELIPGCVHADEHHKPYLVARQNDLCAVLMTNLRFDTTHRNIGKIVDLLEGSGWDVGVAERRKEGE